MPIKNGYLLYLRKNGEATATVSYGGAPATSIYTEAIDDIFYYAAQGYEVEYNIYINGEVTDNGIMTSHSHVT